MSDNTLFVVDAIGGLRADPFRPLEWNVDAFVAGSQKGLMAPPGLAFLGVSPSAIDRSRQVEVRETYFDLPDAVDKLHETNQTPWTPSMNLLRFVLNSLKLLREEGIDNVIERHQTLARVCRRTVKELGMEVFAEVPSNAGTAVAVPGSVRADEVRRTVHDTYGVYLPGGQKHLSSKLIRIGHLGHLDYLDLVSVLGALELGLSREGFIDRPDQSLNVAQETFAELESF